MVKRTKSAPDERDANGNRLHADKPTSNGHYMGRRCGFDYVDGSYRIAPSYASMMEEALIVESGLRVMLAAHNAYIGQQFQKVAELRDRFWKALHDDYDLSGNLIYKDGWVSIVPPEEVISSCIACGLQGFKGIDALVIHQRTCDKHPLGIELRALQAQLAKEGRQ